MRGLLPGHATAVTDSDLVDNLHVRSDLSDAPLPCQEVLDIVENTIRETCINCNHEVLTLAGFPFRYSYALIHLRSPFGSILRIDFWPLLGFSPCFPKVGSFRRSIPIGRRGLIPHAVLADFPLSHSHVPTHLDLD
jgi:hypothetical protein